MKVKIIKAGLDTYWYANKIGKVYTIHHIYSDSYSVFFFGLEHFIEAADCRPLKQRKVAKTTTNTQKLFAKAHLAAAKWERVHDRQPWRYSDVFLAGVEWAKRQLL